MVERTSKGRNLACKILYVKPIILIKIVTIINIFKLFLMEVYVIILFCIKKF